MVVCMWFVLVGRVGFLLKKRGVDYKGVLAFWQFTPFRGWRTACCSVIIGGRWVLVRVVEPVLGIALRRLIAVT